MPVPWKRITIAPDMMRDLRVTMGEVDARAAGETVSALGELHVNEAAYTEVAEPVSARVTKVLAQAGDVVEVGQVLAQLSSPELGVSRAGVEAAQPQLDVARKNAERKRASGYLEATESSVRTEIRKVATASIASCRSRRFTLRAVSGGGWSSGRPRRRHGRPCRGEFGALREDWDRGRVPFVAMEFTPPSDRSGSAIDSHRHLERRGSRRPARGDPIVAPHPQGRGGYDEACAAAIATVVGSVNQNVAPLFGTLSIPMRPPDASMIRFEIVSPSPVPFAPATTFVKYGSNTRR
jgi:hypothetical protein